MGRAAPGSWVLWVVILGGMGLFLVLPLAALLALATGGAWGQVFADPRWGQAVVNSVTVSAAAAAVTTVLALALALAMNSTHLDRRFLRVVRTVVSLPMFLPTLTFGFAILYSYGKQGLITRILGVELFPIYGFGGVLVGLVIYTLPAAFLLLHNAAGYQDRKLELVSLLSGDSGPRLVWTVWIRPLLAVIGGAFVLSFLLAFTDYGIPAALGGDYPLLSTQLYDTILGSVPDFRKGAVLTLFLLVPAALGFGLLQWLERFNSPLDKVTQVDPPRRPVWDLTLAAVCLVIMGAIVATFAVMFLVPFLAAWPYDLTPTLAHFFGALGTNNLGAAVVNSLLVAGLSAALGTFLAFSAAYLTARSHLPGWCRRVLDALALVSNTVPGLVIGVSYLLTFHQTGLKGTMAILVAANIVHFFATPYLMARNALVRMHPQWETAATLLGDSPWATLKGVILPNARTTLVDMATYLFQNSMVTVSAVIFLVSTRTMLVTTKINELQYFLRFDQVFLLSLLVLAANLGAKALASLLKKDHLPKIGLITRTSGEGTKPFPRLFPKKENQA